MTQGHRFPDAVIRRLPIYFRYLKELEAQGVLRISSQELGKRIGYTASQIRQDINCFGGFGHQGYGYEVRNLRAHIGGLLGVEQEYPMAIAGIGNLGRALAIHPIYPSEGYRIIGLFDVEADVVGATVNGMTVRHADELPEWLDRNHVRIGIIATPANQAQRIADLFEQGGVEAIWNFTSTDITSNAHVQNVHLTDSLLELCYRINHILS